MTTQSQQQPIIRVYSHSYTSGLLGKRVFRLPKGEPWPQVVSLLPVGYSGAQEEGRGCWEHVRLMVGFWGFQMGEQEPVTLPRLASRLSLGPKRVR